MKLKVYTFADLKFRGTTAKRHFRNHYTIVVTRVAPDGPCDLMLLKNLEHCSNSVVPQGRMVNLHPEFITGLMAQIQKL